MQVDVKPCPFCGEHEPVRALHNGLDLWSIGCIDCDVDMEQKGGGFFTKREAVDAWNKRQNS